MIESGSTTYADVLALSSVVSIEHFRTRRVVNYLMWKIKHSVLKRDNLN